jgi:hypothetical protein
VVLLRPIQLYLVPLGSYGLDCRWSFRRPDSENVVVAARLRPGSNNTGYLVAPARCEGRQRARSVETRWVGLLRTIQHYGGRLGRCGLVFRHHYGRPDSEKVAVAARVRPGSNNASCLVAPAPREGVEKQTGVVPQVEKARV